MTDASGYILLAAIAVAVFFGLRELWLWYWKVNKVVDALNDHTKLLEEIKELLKKE
jgi:hypothetical protein